MDRAGSGDGMKDGETGFFDIAGVNLEYRWIGPPPAAGTTLVFLHQGLGCISMWRDYPDKVSAAAGLGALVYSRRGYGGSDPSERPWPMSFMHDEALGVLPQVLAKAGIEDVILIGHSDGGTIALVYGGAYPSPKIAGIVVEAPHVFIEPKLVEQSVAVGARFEDPSSGLRAGLARHHGDKTDDMFRGWNEVFRGPDIIGKWSIVDYLPKIGAPVLAIQGEDDEFATMAHLDTIARLSGGPVELLKLPDCGHSPHREMEDAVLAATTRFIRSLT